MACGSNQLDTAIGCISYDNPADVITRLLALGAAIGGVVAIGLVALGAGTILTSAGEPEKLMEGREMITNALMGLAMIVLSVFVLEFLGVQILGITELNHLV
jgi:hypothetical protein